ALNKTDAELGNATPLAKDIRAVVSEARELIKKGDPPNPTTLANFKLADGAALTLLGDYLGAEKILLSVSAHKVAAVSNLANCWLFGIYRVTGKYEKALALTLALNDEQQSYLTKIERALRR
ncbi:MAG: hypothetical protein Q8N36_05890, partial [bacterium]|nr:hypothetical protein [bacterium]